MATITYFPVIGGTSGRGTITFFPASVAVGVTGGTVTFFPAVP